MICHDKFERFSFFVLPRNTGGSVTKPLKSAPTNLAFLTIHSDCDDAVLLTATVGWLAVTNGSGLSRVNVLFKIWRDGTLVFSADDSAEANSDKMKVTSFTHVDTGFGVSKSFNYFLTAELPDAGSAATVIGPITFTATEIDK